MAEPVTVLLEASVSRGASLFVFLIHAGDECFLHISISPVQQLPSAWQW